MVACLDSPAAPAPPLKSPLRETDREPSRLRHLLAENRKSLRPSKGRRLESFRGTTLIHPPVRADLMHPLRGLTATANNRDRSLHRSGSEASSPASSPVCTTHRLSVGEGKATTPHHCLYQSVNNRKNPRRLSRVFSAGRFFSETRSPQAFSGYRPGSRNRGARSGGPLCRAAVATAASFRRRPFPRAPS